MSIFEKYINKQANINIDDKNLENVILNYFR